MKGLIGLIFITGLILLFCGKLIMLTAPLGIALMMFAIQFAISEK